MPVLQAGQLNTTANIAPDAYVLIQPPSIQSFGGVSTSRIGFVGTAPWGPVNAPVPGDMRVYAANFGAIQARKYDIGTLASMAAQQGISDFVFVRVTDGTDTAGQVAVQTNCITFTSKYTGTLAPSVTISAGTVSGAWNVVVGMSGLVPEYYKNIGAGLTGNALWVAIAAAINSGIQGSNGPSGMIVAAAGVGTTGPVAATYTCSGGTDGASGVTPSILVGADGNSRTGMYALRGSKASLLVLCDCDNPTYWSPQQAFGLSEGMWPIMVGPVGQSVSAGVSALATAGISGSTGWEAKVLLGDWLYFNDPVNLVTRLVSPQGAVAGRYANLSPEQSGLNKPIYGVVTTQRVASSVPYSAAEIQLLYDNGIDVVTLWNGQYTLRTGRNASNVQATGLDNYSRLTNYIPFSIEPNIKNWVGKVQTPAVQRAAKASIEAFFFQLAKNGVISTVDGSLPFQVVLDKTNNPQTSAALGYMYCAVKVVYGPIIERFVVSVEGGQTVVISRTVTTA